MLYASLILSLSDILSVVLMHIAFYIWWGSRRILVRLFLDTAQNGSVICLSNISRLFAINSCESTVSLAAKRSQSSSP